MQTVHWLYQLTNLSPILDPLLQHRLEWVVNVVQVKLVIFLLLPQSHQDVVELGGVLGGDGSQSGVAVHPASTGTYLKAVEPVVDILVLEVLVIQDDTCLPSSPRGS